jgi:hypothetical protein
MSLSDEILARPGRIASLRNVLSQLAKDLGASSAFLVDESGVPFAAIGHVQFDYPHPLSALAGEASGAAVLEALLGEPRRGTASPFLSCQVSPRALVAIVLECPIGGWKRRAAMGRVKRAVKQLRPLLEILPES